MAYTSKVTFLSSAARTTSGESGELNLSYGDEILVFLDVTAVSGTSPTLDVKVQTKGPDGKWYDIASFAQKTGTGNEAKAITNYGEILKVVYTIGGTTPSFTFSVTGVVKTRG